MYIHLANQFGYILRTTFLHLLVNLCATLFYILYEKLNLNDAVNQNFCLNGTYTTMLTKLYFDYSIILHSYAVVFQCAVGFFLLTLAIHPIKSLVG